MGARPPNPFENKKIQTLSAFREQQGGKGKRKLWGLRPQTPLKIKRFKPCPRSAFREQQGGKEKRKAWGLFAPKPLTRVSVGRNGAAVSFLPAANVALVCLT